MGFVLLVCQPSSDPSYGVEFESIGMMRDASNRRSVGIMNRSVCDTAHAPKTRHKQKRTRSCQEMMIFTYFERVSSGSFNILLPPMIYLLFNVRLSRFTTWFYDCCCKRSLLPLMASRCHHTQQQASIPKFTMRDVKK